MDPVLVDLNPRAMLEKEEDSGVCRAVVDGFPVVIKFVVSCDPRRIKAIRDEGTIYFERLEDLQGVAIPCLYACFKGTLLVTTEDRDFTSSVLCLFLKIAEMLLTCHFCACY